MLITLHLSTAVSMMVSEHLCTRPRTAAPGPAAGAGCQPTHADRRKSAAPLVPRDYRHTCGRPANPRTPERVCFHFRQLPNALILSPFPLWAPCGRVGCCLYEPGREGWRGCWCYICKGIICICKFKNVNKVTFVYKNAGLVFLKLRLSNTAVIFTEFPYVSVWYSTF